MFDVSHETLSLLVEEWAGNLELKESLDREQNETIAAYCAKPKLLQEHFNEEDGYRAGSYGQRLIPELIQNSADAMSGPSAGRLQLLLTDNYLYCANDGEPLTNAGMIAILNSHLSPKSNDDLGRFGLGFKSVLAVTDRPDVISRSVSFSFNRQVSRQRLEAVGLNNPDIPLLRMGWPLDPIQAFEDDAELAQLGTWASTIIRLPLRSGTELVQAGIRALDPHILLFLPMVRALTVTVRTALFESEEVLTVATDDQGWATISHNDVPLSRWLVQSKVLFPSADALATVPRAIARPKILLSYAAPEETNSRGHFSAVFPLRDQTTARGIFSAPWHISDDRSGLLVSKFNDEIIEVFAELILETLPLVAAEDDPGRSLEYLPVDPAESSPSSHYDGELSRRIRRIAREYACTPDCSGKFRMPEKLSLPNLDLKLVENQVKKWAGSPHTPSSCAHWTCYRSDTRRARLRGLVRGFGAKQPNETRLADWLDLMVRRRDLGSCLDALLLLTSFGDDKMASQGSKVQAIPTAGGQLARADSTDTVFIASELPEAIKDVRRVSGDFLALPGALEVLEALGFQHLTVPRQLSLLLWRNKGAWTHREWRGLWGTASRLPKEEAISAITKHMNDRPDLNVPAADGTWRSPQRVLAPGVVSPRSASITLDTSFAAEWDSLLPLLQIVDRPQMMALEKLSGDEVLDEYKHYVNRLYGNEFPDGSRYLEFDQDQVAGPLWPLTSFRNQNDWDSLAKWTLGLLTTLARKEWSYGPIFLHAENVLKVQAPHLWAVNRYGLASTSWGERSLATAVSKSLSRFSRLLPVVNDAEVSTGSMPSRLTDVSQELFMDSFRRGTSETDPWVLGEFIASASRCLLEALDDVDITSFVAPKSVTQELTLVARSKAEVDFLNDLGVPFIACHEPNDIDELTKRAAFSDVQSGLSMAVLTEEARPPEPVFDRFGRLRTDSKTRDVLRAIFLVACKDIQITWKTAEGSHSASVESALERESFFFSEDLGDEEILRRLLLATDVDLDERTQNGILQSSLTMEAERRRRRCRELHDVPSKLNTLVSLTSMKKILPAGLLDLVGEAAMSAQQSSIPRLFSSVFGESALEELSAELTAAGFETPYRWSGSTAARRFVQDLGFPEAYAGESGRPREPLLSVPGPMKVAPLHDFQRKLVDEIKELVNAGGRGMLHLPTGAGKTRTAAQAVVEMVRSRRLAGPVLWIAQSDELCEQSVLTFESLWRSVGDDRRLDIHRFWGGNDLGVDAGEGPRIVVATDAKLARQIDEDRNVWLRETAALVVVDEAHLAMGKNYDTALRAMGINESANARPLLGLTATPYRGKNVSATFELAAFFGHRKLAMHAADPMAELQSRGILSRVEHDVIRGSQVELIGDEITRLRTQRLIPPSVMNRIAQDQTRMRALLEHIAALPQDWPVIVFTPSVQSARILAALLLLRDISAVALSGETSPAIRRKEIEKFRGGVTKVLVNCDLFTRGFDAPNVRALYVGRPTFSPNAYLQMVGRGLRGPANGGSEKCLIVNFADTFGEFGEELAFKKLDFLWGNGIIPH